MKWYAAHHGMPFDPKFQKVARRSGQPAIVVVGIWVVILDNVSQSAERGTLDGFDAESVDIAMGMKDGTTQAIMDAMQGLLLDGDRVPAFMGRQPKDPTGAERKRKQRSSASRDTGDSHGTSQDVTVLSRDKSDCHTEEKRGEEKREEKQTKKGDAGAPPDPSPVEYAFEGSVIRLTDKDLNRWRRSFKRIDVDAELEGLDLWLAEPKQTAKRKNWFQLAIRALQKKNSGAPPPQSELENIGSF